MERARPANSISIVGRKQLASHEDFLAAEIDIESLVNREELQELIDRTVLDIRTVTAGTNAAYAWSGGKDSIALGYVVEIAGVRECLMGMTDLEFPEFLRFVTDNMPARLEVINTGLNLEWLIRHPTMLFPQDSTMAGKWFKLVQHTAQERFFKSRRLDMLLVGRRRSDGNFMGKDGSGIYEARGIKRYAPLMHWRHEDVLALVHYHRLPVAPIYRWPRGYRVGTGPWPARQWTQSVENGWAEVWAIDPGVVRAAAPTFAPAEDWMRRHGKA